MSTSVHRSLGVSTLLEFYKKNRRPVLELEKTEGEFEQTGCRGNAVLWTPRISTSDDEVVYRNKMLMLFVWHFQDFFWQHGVAVLGKKASDCQTANRLAIEKSDALKLCGFFSNKEKHIELTDFKKYPAFKAKPPKLGRVLVDFFTDGGQIAYTTDLIGALGHQCSSPLDFAQTVEIENYKPNWDTRRAAEEASWDWIDLLRSVGLDLGVQRPAVAEDGFTIDFLGLGTSPFAVESRSIKLPDWLVCAPATQEDFERQVIISGLLSIPPEWIADVRTH